MDTINLVAIGNDSGSAFGKTFAEYSTAFSDRNHIALCAAFASNAKVTIRDRRVDQTLELTPAAFFERLYKEIETASFQIENATAQFNDGYLFVDGTWIDQQGDPLLRAADLFTTFSDGQIAALDVVWTHAH